VVYGAPRAKETIVIVAESRVGRKIVGRLERGADLLPALVEVCRARDVRSGELRALGALESAEVCEYDQQARVYLPSRRFAARFEILSLYGNVSEKGGQLFPHVHASLSRERDNGIEVIGGHFLGGRVFSVEFVIDTWDDLLLRRGLDSATGLHLWQEALPIPTGAAASPPERPSVSRAPEVTSRPVQASTPTATPTSATSVTAKPTSATWADVIASSEAAHLEVPPTAPPPPRRVPDEEADEGQGGEEAQVEVLEAGDVLVHPTFGRCVIQRIEGDYEFASVRLRNQRLVRLAIDVLDLRREGEEEGHRVFRARIR
jgi:predicted DNA-binding protein with PD1-like motif